MSLRTTWLAALAAAAVTSPLAAQEFGYAPGSATYQASVVTKMTREVAGQRTEDELTQRQRLFVGLTAKGADTLGITIRLDSAAISSRSAGAQDVSQLVGLTVDGRVSPLGRVYSSSLASRDIGPTGEMIARELARFLPTVRADLRPGLAWADTVTEEIDMLGLPVTRQVVTVSTVEGDTVVSGDRAWKIDRNSEVTFTGSGSMSGQQIRLAGTSTADGMFLVSLGGRFLGSRQTDRSRTTFTMPASGMEIGLTQEQTTSVNLIED